MNGMVVIDSTPGNGTSVKIMLPLSRAEMDLNSRNTGKSPVSAALSGIQPRIMSLTLRSPGRFWKKKVPKSPGQPMERKPWTASSTLQSAFSILFWWMWWCLSWMVCKPHAGFVRSRARTRRPSLFLPWPPMHFRKISRKAKMLVSRNTWANRWTMKFLPGKYLKYYK